MIEKQIFSEETPNLRSITKEKNHSKNTRQTIEHERRDISARNEVIDRLIQLEKEGKYRSSKSIVIGTLPTNRILSPKLSWYWATMLFSLVAVILVLAIQGQEYPLVYLRYVMGTFFVLFIPGFTLEKALFPEGTTTKPTEVDTRSVERVALSFGLSLIITPIAALILNYTPYGLDLVPITLTILFLVILFATAAAVREEKSLKQTE